MTYKNHSKRFKLLKTLILNKLYTYEEAINKVKSLGTTKFIESIESHISLNINPKYITQQLRTTLILPYNTGKPSRIAIFTNSTMINTFLEKGALFAGTDIILKSIIEKKINFDILITTPDLMPQLAKYGKILGPKGLMPSQKFGTVTQEPLKALQEFQKGKFEYKADKTGIVHINIGKVTFSEKEIKENLLAVYSSIEKNKPQGVHGSYFKSFNICTTMSPSIKIDLLSFKNL